MDDSVDIINMEERIAFLEQANHTASKKAEELRKIREMPFIKRMKLPSQLLELERLEAFQKDTFQIIIKRYAPHLVNEWKDLFAEYFTMLMSEKTHSINDFLFSNATKRELKERFIDR